MSSETVIVETGTGVMDTTASPLTPAEVAEMFAEPAATPVTNPSDDTVAIASELEDQVKDFPLRTVPPASFAWAVAVKVFPTSSVAEGAVTITEAIDATGGALIPPAPPSPLPPPPHAAAAMRRSGRANFIAGCVCITG